ncbi:MAG: phage portal protein [Anaerolineae bacterium]|jgi:HK97 family phage portal protein|nr:phage portal protein [Anaerolineae bacterium]
MFNWLSSLLSFPIVSRLRTTPPPLIPQTIQHSVRATPQISHLNAYEASSWVYVAINRIAEASALVPLHVYRIEGDRRLEVVRHPLEVLLDAPNPFLSRFELFEQTLGFLELTGNAYWLLIGDESGRPREIWPLRPDRMTIVPDAYDHIKGYVYEVDGQRMPLSTLEVIHFKRWHPANDYYGLSALEAARVAILSDRAMAEWNKNTFGDDHGVPAGVVNIRERISDADFERIKREWRTAYGAGQRRTAFVRGGEIEWRSIGLSHTDLDFLQGRKAHRDEILNIFGIPVGLVSDNATEANAKVAERLFIERTLYPKLVRIAQKISQDLLPFWSEDGIAQFEDIRPTDQGLRLQEITAALPVLSINEIRERFYQLPPVSWGDQRAGQ